MPVVKGIELTPDEAIALDLCPETGKPLAEVNPEEHVQALWPRGASEEGMRRKKMILDWHAGHPKTPATPVASLDPRDQQIADLKAELAASKEKP
jgi:hypothetical protein